MITEEREWEGREVLPARFVDREEEALCSNKFAARPTQSLWSVDACLLVGCRRIKRHGSKVVSIVCLVLMAGSERM